MGEKCECCPEASLPLCPMIRILQPHQYPYTISSVPPVVREIIDLMMLGKEAKMSGLDDGWLWR